MTTLALLVYFPLLFLRLFLKKEILSKIIERFGISLVKRPNGNLIWIHSASVGEFNVAMNLADKIVSAYNKTGDLQKNFNNIKDNICNKNGVSAHSILFTTATVSAYYSFCKNMQKFNFSDSKFSFIHQFIPFDNIFFIKLFLAKWKPSLTIFIESEILPCAFAEVAKQSRLLLLSVRISDKSYHRWEKYYYVNKFFAQIINKSSAIVAQTRLDFIKLKKLGAQNVQNFGNLKFINKKLDFDIIISNAIKNYINNSITMQKVMVGTEDLLNRNELIDTHDLVSQENNNKLLRKKLILVAASTHFTDEEVIFRALAKAKAMLDQTIADNLYLIIIPRHPDRVDQIVQECKQKYKLNPEIYQDCWINNILENSNEKENDSAMAKMGHFDNLLIVDSFGKNGLFYSIADIIFVGGSFTSSIGGHNALEALLFNKMVVFGPHMENAQEISNELIKAQAALRINSSESLLRLLGEILENKVDCKNYIENAKSYLSSKRLIEFKYMKLISKYLP